VRLPARRSLVTAGAIALLALTGVGVLLAAQAISPHISLSEATAAATRQVQQMNSVATGYTLVSGRYDPSPDKIYDDRGNLIHSESRSACLVAGIQVPSFLCHADAAWILHLQAPAQAGHGPYDAYVVVNATTGSVSSASVTGG